MRPLASLMAAGILWCTPVLADEALPSAPAKLHLLDDGSGSGDWGESWTPDGRTIGVGLQLGFPSALTAEFVTGGRNSLVLGLGVFGYRFLTPALSLYLDYLWHPGVLGRSSSVTLSWYVGLGGWLFVYPAAYTYGGYVYGGNSNLAAALRVPVGLDLSLGQLPLMFYAELVPALLVYPGIDLGLGASVGGRVFF